MSSFPPPQIKYKLALVKAQDIRLSHQTLWRSCFVVFCAVSIFLLATLPYWQIKHQSQIEINGEKLISKSSIYNALKISYPQFIWKINGLNLAKQIESIPSIAGARINRIIIPPKLIVSLQEKAPIALATSQGKVGFLDTNGLWIDQKFYDNISADFALPKLKVLNYQIQYQPEWVDIYQLISLYPELEITELQWNQSGDLLLHTKIGKVFLGSDLSQLKRQFKTMLKLQNLPDYIENSQIAYIDLSNPNLDLIQKY